MNKGLFKDKKLRMSTPRLLIYQELSGSRSQVSPHDLYQGLLKKHKKIGLTSIYRTLDLFESMEMVFKISNGSGVKYKLCEMENSHHHITCKACGNVVEFDFCDISD